MKRKSIQLPLTNNLEKKLQEFFKEEIFFLFNSNGYGEGFEWMIAAGAEKELSFNGDPFYEFKIIEENKDWWVGYISYDLKNNIEKLPAPKPDSAGFPLFHFFIQKFIFLKKNNQIEIRFIDTAENENRLNDLFLKLSVWKESKDEKISSVKLQQKVSRNDYIEVVNKIKKHIQRGDIYEINYCIDFFANNVSVALYEVYNKLNALSPMPFSCFFSHGEFNLICASPERFIKKEGEYLISQPMKGTIRRGKTEEEDVLLKEALRNSKKEQSENVMITDLVRNDLSKTAVKGSVKVEELFGIFTYKNVHQMISTVSSKLRKGITFSDIIQTTFPMGSMTGAPKVRAMELIDEFETSPRGLFSGTVGYITPEGNFDFNVVIRSIFYNSAKKHLSFKVGSAITINANAEDEYEECILKAGAIFSVLELNEHTDA